MALAPLVIGPTCSYPTDESDSVEVTITGTAFVLRGQRETLSARAVRLNGSDTTPLQNVIYGWSSADPNLATVKDLGSGFAEVTGVNLGTDTITARAVAFEAADVRPFMLRVSDPVVVDSVRPDSVRWGDTVTVFGIGVESELTQANLGLGELIAVPFSAGVDSSGIGRRAFWVPFPSRTNRLLYIGPGIFGTAPDTTTVEERDIYEPNDTAPRDIFFDGERPFPQLPAVRLLNPALAFERLVLGDTIAADWYRYDFFTTPPNELTIVLTAPAAAGTFTSFLTSSLTYGGAPGVYDIGADAWTIGPREHACHGLAFSPLQRIPDSTIIALTDLSSLFGSPLILDHLVRYTRDGSYGLRITEGYLVTAPAVAPRDDHEEDDLCHAADALNKRVPFPFRDTLTIDNPLDVDWIRFTLPTPQRLRLRTAAIGPPPAARDTARDLTVYIAKVPIPTDILFQTLSGPRPGPNEDFTTPVLPAGDYYVVVVDVTGVPTTYDICIGAVGGTCDAFPVAQMQGAANPSAGPADGTPLRRPGRGSRP